MPKITANNIKINYEIKGQGPNLLFINGIGADLKNPLSLFNSPIPKHFTVLAFDPRGLGESDSPEYGCTIADMAEDAAALAKAVGWENYHVFGASMGGMVAQELAIHHPEAVNKLVLAVTHSGGAGGAPQIIDNMFSMSPLELSKASDTRQDEKWAAEHPEMLERMKASIDAMRMAFDANPAHLRGYNYQAAAVSKHDTTDRLSKITADTFVFNGRYDGGVPVASAKKMVNRIPNCKFELVDSGHGTWFFDPTVWAMVIDFLEK